MSEFPGNTNFVIDSLATYVPTLNNTVLFLTFTLQVYYSTLYLNDEFSLEEGKDAQFTQN